MKFIKIFLALCVVLPVVVLCLVLFAPQHIDWNSQRGLLESILKSKTGMDVALNGDVSLQVLPNPVFKSDNIEIKAFRGDKSLFSVKNVVVELSLADLINGGLGLKKLHLNELSLYLQRNGKGQANWEPKRVKYKRSASAPDLSFVKSIGDVVLSNVNFVYEDDVTGQQFRLENAGLSAQSESLETTTLSLEGTLNNAPLVMNVQTNLSNLDVAPVDASLLLGESEALLKGNIYDPLGHLKYEGNISVRGDDFLKQIYDIVNAAPQERIAIKSIDFNAGVIYTADAVDIKKMALSFASGSDVVKLKGGASVDMPSKVQKIKVDISVENKLNLNALGLCDAPKANTATASSTSTDDGWSNDSIDLTALKTLDVVASVSLNKGLICENYTLDGLMADVTIRDKKINLQNATILSGKGRMNIAGNMNLSASQYAGMASVSFDKFPVMSFANLKAQKRMTLPLGGDVKVSFKGNSIAEWIANLNGTTKLVARGSEIKRINTASFQTFVKTLFAPSGVAGSTTNADVNIVSEIENGLLRTSDVSVLTSTFDIIVDGKVDLSRKAMNLRVSAVEDGDNASKVPMLVRGKFSGLTAVPDVVSAGTNILRDKIGGASGELIGGILDSVLGVDLPKSERLQGVNGSKKDNSTETPLGGVMQILRGQ